LDAAVLLNDALADEPVDANAEPLVKFDRSLVDQVPTKHTEVMDNTRMDRSVMVRTIAECTLDRVPVKIDFNFVRDCGTKSGTLNCFKADLQGIRRDEVIVINERDKVVLLRIVHP
jgi:hypothetical protein